MIVLSIILTLVAAYFLVLDHDRDKEAHKRAKGIHTICTLLLVFSFGTAPIKLLASLVNLEAAVNAFSLFMGVPNFFLAVVSYIIFLSLGTVLLVLVALMIRRNDRARGILLFVLPPLGLMLAFLFPPAWSQMLIETFGHASLILALSAVLSISMTVGVEWVYASRTMRDFFQEEVNSTLQESSEEME